ncbi:MAG: PKD domain-containing protein [Myxococcota bacterium]|nr:PKD domain-containing protein [Myxococcota bacterium]
MRTDEGCQNTSYGKITFQHQDSYHMDPKRKIQEYQWLFQTVESPTNETFAAIPWNNLALDEPDLEYKSYHTTDEFAAVVWQYLHAGNYHAALRVKDNSPTPKYNIYSIKNITVAPQPDLAPTANAHGPYEVIEGNDLVLEGAASDPNLLCRADGLTSTWYLPATVPRPGVGLAGPAPWLGVLDQIPTRNTPVPIKLVVSDSQAATADATSETTVTIWDRDFHPCFDLTPSTTVGCNGTVHVDASCTYPHPHTGTGFRTFEWQCNNPLPLEAAGFAFTAQAVGLASDCTYTTEGSYYLTLKVTDNYGTVQYVQQQVTMSSSSAPRANAGPGYTLETWLVNEWDAETLRQGGSITLDGSGSSDPDAACGDSITKYEWDLNGDWIADDLNGDGVVTDLDRVARPTLTWANLYKLLPPAWDKTKYLANPRTGLPNLPVNLTVTDEHGKTARASSSLTIYHSGPYARYTANPNPASCGEGAPPVTFDGSTSWHGHPAKTIAQWAWVFDMPEAVTGADPALILAKFAEHVDALGPRVTYNYPAFGVYHPVLRVTDGQGRMSLAYGATVVVSEGNAAPQVDIGGPYEFAVGGLLQLDARGTVDPNEGCGDDAVLYEWDLDGDGVFAEPSPEQGKAAEPVGEAPILQWSQVSHWIPASAWPAAPPDWGERWTVGLKVTDTRGASATATVEIPIYEQTPVAVADSAPKPFVPIDTATGKALVRLDGSWSYTSDPGLKILQWSWKLGAGTQTTTGETAQLQVDLNAERPIWSVAGGTVTKPITLRVTDSGNNIADDTIDVTFKVLASTPATIRFADDQLLIQQQDPLTVAASATPAPNLTVDYVGWDLDGNGSDDVVWNRGDPGTPEQALQLNRAWGDLPAALRALGAHEVRLTVTDSLGTVSQDAVKVTVLEHALRAAIVVTPPLGGCTTTFAFDASGSESLIESEIVRYSWNFGDGTTGTGLAANHAYGQFGTYTVTLTVEDDGVVTHTASATATVSTTNGNLPPVVEANGPYFLDSDRFSQDETLRLTLTGQGTTDPDSACGDTITRYRWDLDGLLDLQGNRTWEIDTAASEVSISWADVQRWNLPAGNVNRQIYLQAEDRHGGRSESWTTLQIGSGQPVARFRATPLTAMCGEPVSFDATESYHPVPSLSIKTLAWDFDYDGIFTPSALHVNEKIFRQVLPRVGKVIVRLRAGDENDTYNYFDVEINNSGDNAAPIPRAKPVLAAFGEVVVLDASLSMDPNEACGDQVSWFAWDLNDDGVIDSEGAGAIQTMSAAKFQSFGFAVQEPFDQTPVKIGKLYVQDMDEKPATTEVKIYYYQVTPHPVATVQPPKAGCQVEMVFDGSGSYHNHPARKITHYAWDLDTTVDSDKNGVANDDTDGVGVQFRYAGYREKKAYGAQLTVTDEYGKVASVAVSPSPEVSFENQKPIANPGGPYLTTIGNDGTIPVNLDGNGSSDPNEPCDAITEYAWDTDGDGCYGEEDELGVVTANKPLCGTAATAGSAMCGAEDCTGDVVNVASSTWRVGQTYVVGLIVKDRYGTWSDVAETMITVAESVPPTVTIVHPNGGEVWGKDPTAVNQTRAIELKLSHPKGKRARLKLSMNGEELVLANDLYDAPVTPQTYTIPFDTTLFANKTDFYRLKVLAELETDPAIFSTTLSQSPFSIDNAGPTITTTPATDMTLATAVEQLDAAGTEVAASAQVADQDPAPVVTYKLNGAAVAKIPSKFPLGRNVLEISAQDWLRPVPNKTVATRVIWVKDTRAPDLLPGPDVVMKARGVDGFTPVDFSPSAYDLCAGDLSSAITLSAAAGIDTIDGEELIYGFPVGTRTVQFEVLDGEGNPASATITVTIVDDEPPYFTQEPSDVAFPQTSPAGTLATGLVGSADWPQVLYRDDGYATAQLTCGLFVTLVDQDGDPVDPPAAGYSCTAPVFPAGAYFPIGVTTMTYVVEDPGGLSASTEVQLTVVGADPVAHLLTRPASDEWLNCAVDSCVLEFSVENVNPAWPVTVTPLPRAGDPQPLPEDGKYRLTYAADGVYLVRISMWDRADLEHIQQVPRFNIDTSGPTSTVTDFDQEGAVPGDPATWPLFFRGEEAAPRFAAQDGLSGIEQVKVTVVPGLLEGGAKTILDRPQSLSGTPPTGPKFLGNLSCTDEANVCRGGKLFLGGMQAGEQKLVVESKDGAGNLSTTEFPFRLIGLAEALVIVRTRIAGYLQADPEGAAVSLLQQIDGYLATGQRSLSRGYLGGTLVSIYDAVSIMRGAALRLVATDELEAELLEDARLLARGSYAETYLYWKLNAVGTSEEQTAYIALAQAWEFIWTDGQYDAAVLKISNAYFYARNGKFPFRATDVPSSIDVIHRIMAELQGYTQYRELPAVEEADELLHDLDALVLWRFENLQNPGWLPAKEFMELLLDLQDLANQMFMAQSKGCWVRNWQWGFAQAIRVVIDVAKADAEGHLPPGHAQYCKIQEAQVQYDLGMGYLDNREPDLMLDLYANWSKGIRCLMLEIYHHAGYLPVFPVEDWGCQLQGCGGAAEQD